MLKKLLSRINIIDIIIAVLFTLVTFSVISGIVSRRSGKALRDFEIIAAGRSCPEYITSKINEGSLIFEYDSEKSLGKISKKEIRSRGQDTADLYLTVSLKGKKEEQGITVSGVRLLIGKYLNIISENAMLPIIIEDIREVGENA